MTTLAELAGSVVALVGELPDLAVAGLMPLAVALAVWPGAALAARLTTRDTRPAVNRQVSYRPGRAVVLSAPGVLDATLVDPFPRGAW